MKPSVLVAARFLPRLFGRRASEYSLHGLEGVEPDAIPPEARDARAIITIGGLRTDAALMDALPKLGLIACYGTGYEGVDRAAARARGIVVTHGGDTNSTAVAEFAFGLVIASARGMIRGDRFARAGKWRGDIIERTAITPELAGQRLGVYGLGSIGAKIATRAAAFEMEIGYHNRRQRSDVPYAYHPTLIGLAEWADILVVAVRADASNTYAINKEVLTALGPRGHVVNISRGIAVDTQALCDALEAGTIAGAALDVFESEPLQAGSPLLNMENVVLTSHSVGWTQELFRDMRRIDCEGALAVMRGEAPHSVVNREVLERPGFQQKLARYRERSVSQPA
jgi:lactate dehydrogenase-like 2-hydroxyacid dehydrogenase